LTPLTEPTQLKALAGEPTKDGKTESDTSPSG